MILNFFIQQPHRPKAEGSGGRHKKRVRQPYSTRERQRQLATQHGEYIMPQDNSHYRAPHQVYSKLSIEEIINFKLPL